MLEFLDKPGFLIVALAGILIFGAKRLPEAARSLGRSMRILKAETKGLHEDGASTPSPTPVATPQAAIVASPAPVIQPVAPATPVAEALHQV